MAGLLNSCSPYPAQTPTPILNASLQVGTQTPAPRPTLSPVPITATAVQTVTTLIESSPTPTRSPTQTSVPCASQAGTLLDKTIDSKQLGKPLSYRVYLPPCYQADGETRYPVLYLLHGQDDQDDQWTRLGLAPTADRLIDQSRIDPMIVVMPYDSDWRQPTESHFGEAVVEELLPWIDGQYPTRAGRLNRAIGGLSRGAAWALHLGLTDWLAFGSIGAHSLPIFWTDTQQIPKWLNAIPPADMPRIYLDVSAKDEDLASNLGFEALLNRLHIPHEWHLFNGYHDDTYWSAHLEVYLLWYSQGWAGK